ncbi:pancreatic alpha-amylase-like [Ambystoma mexicanum]|uniref:pancreatic alpha-amylase-like n=1 Tax=Ambystoma mexicanum TaxID=8296 RepID=UPI0037E95CF9
MGKRLRGSAHAYTNLKKERLLLLLAALGLSWAQYNPNIKPGRTAVVHLFEWRWADIASECERYLGPNGFGGVQISPPSENIVITNPNRPWWERYQPIRYKLCSASGNEQEFRDMVTRCNNVGTWECQVYESCESVKDSEYIGNLTAVTEQGSWIDLFKFVRKLKLKKFFATQVKLYTSKPQEPQPSDITLQTMLSTHVLMSIDEYGSDPNMNIMNLMHDLNIEQQTLKIKELSNKSKFTPVFPKDNLIDTFHQVVTNDIHKLQDSVKQKNTRFNLSIKEQQALHTLASIDTIIIKEADKGGNVVILDKVDYITMGLAHLDSPGCYEILPGNPTTSLRATIKLVVDKWLTAGLLTDVERQFLIVDGPTMPTAYFLPKIHKPFVKIPEGRPILSGGGGILEPTSLYINECISPLVNNIPTFIRDTMHILQMLNQLPMLPNLVLVTLDVKALYTSINHRQAISNDDAPEAVEEEIGDKMEGSGHHPSTSGGRGVVGHEHPSVLQASLSRPSSGYGSDDLSDSDVDLDAHESMMSMVRDCRLVSLLDLALEKDYVRGKIADFLNNLISIGVAGFRLDAAKHMWPGDIKAILNRLQNLNTQWFRTGTKPFIFQEVIDLGGEGISTSEYFGNGRVTEFKYGAKLGNVIRKWNGEKMCYLKNWGEGWGFMPSDRALVFVDNHDNQRGHGAGGASILTFFDARLYKMGVGFMLAHPYGFTRVMSSFRWPRNFVNGKDVNDWIGPPRNPDGSTKPVSINADTTCAGDWVCEHRWRQIKNMVIFRNAVDGQPFSNWWDNGNSQVAFGRGNKGFIIFNNDDWYLDVTLKTGLPAGTYCDVISGQKENGLCTGKQINVGRNSSARFQISNTADDPFVAIHVGHKL